MIYGCSSPNEVEAPVNPAQRLFAPIAPNYERWARILSLDQDRRWRSIMVSGLGLGPGSRVLDVAAGTGSISLLLERGRMEVVALDQSAPMLSRHPGRQRVLAAAGQLPFADNQFDGLTFGYLLRYVGDVAACLGELVRVVRPGGVIGMVEFGRPPAVWGTLWLGYTRLVLPAVGRLIKSGWENVGSFLGPSIESFYRTYPVDHLRRCWEDAGLGNVRLRRLSKGGGLVMWGQKV